MLKSHVLENCVLTFSGVVPTGYDLKKQRCYLMATSLGAKVNENLVLAEDQSDEEEEADKKEENNKVYKYDDEDSMSSSNSSGGDNKWEKIRMIHPSPYLKHKKISRPHI